MARYPDQIDDYRGQTGWVAESVQSVQEKVGTGGYALHWNTQGQLQFYKPRLNGDPAISVVWDRVNDDSNLAGAGCS